MKPKASNVLERYDLEVLRTCKVRGAILCEADKGLFILKEFGGRGEKLALQNAFLIFLKEQGFSQAEEILKNKEGELFSQDTEGCGYLVKTYVDGRECCINKGVDSLEDGTAAMQVLARIHFLSRKFTEGFYNAADIKKGIMEGISDSAGENTGIKRSSAETGRELSLLQEFEKHNRELKRVKRFLKEKGRKNEFEHFLLKHYDRFLEQALSITKQLQEENAGQEDILLCHGDFQYHNVLFEKEKAWVMNFERCVWDNRTRDICHFGRKMLEKCGWLPEVGEKLLDAYEKVYPLTPEDGKQLYYRFCYPEKFWKIVNFYYNRGKAFIPDKNREKLENVLYQEECKQDFIKMVVCRRFSI